MENSEILLNKALEALKSVDIPADYWAVGGGTVLKTIYNHRNSKDIDIFIRDAQFLSSLSPNLNDVTIEALDYNEMANFISLTYPEGKVDFIVAGQVTSFSPTQRDFCGHKIMVEDPVEIVCKKIFYRGSEALPRDIFDLAVVFNSDRQKDLIKAALSIEKKFNEFATTFKKLSMKPKYSDRYTEMLRDEGLKIKGKEYQICDSFISQVKKQLQQFKR